jgi:hypothetical protein
MHKTWLAPLCAIVVLPGTAAAQQADSAAYVDVDAGPAFATYLQIDANAGAQEHLSRAGQLIDLGVGYGFELCWGRIDLGFRGRVLHLYVTGRYDVDVRDDAFAANYDFLSPAIATSIASSFEAPVDLFGGITLGTATLISDRQGAEIEARQIPVFGTFDAGLLFELTAWLELRATIAWIPPVDTLNVLAPQLGLRARL